MIRRISKLRLSVLNALGVNTVLLDQSVHQRTAARVSSVRVDPPGLILLVKSLSHTLTSLRTVNALLVTHALLELDIQSLAGSVNMQTSLLRLLAQIVRKAASKTRQANRIVP